MKNPLLAHFVTMQDKMREYVTPGPYYEHTGPASAAENDHAAQSELFAADMIYLMDGPEQREAQAHAEFDYVKLALRTMPPETQFYGERVGFAEFIGAINNAIDALNKLDRVKKSLFYNRDNNLDPREGQRDSGEIIDMLSRPENNLSHNQAVRLVHAAIGLATEGGEVLEALRNAYNGEGYDPVNFVEEFGDAKWYMAILTPQLNVEWGDDERTNIAKLQARFPDKFTTTDANNRDLGTERDVLSSGFVQKAETTGFAQVEGDTPRAKTQFEGTNLGQADPDWETKGFPAADNSHLGAVPVNVGKSDKTG